MLADLLEIPADATLPDEGAAADTSSRPGSQRGDVEHGPLHRLLERGGVRWQVDTFQQERSHARVSPDQVATDLNHFAAHALEVQYATLMHHRGGETWLSVHAA